MSLKYTNIAIECSDSCNMRCVMCNQRNAPQYMHGAGFRGGFLSVKTFSKLVSDLSKSSLEIGCINPCWAGESTLNPDFDIFMKILFEQNKKKPFFKRFVLNSNGLEFNEGLAEVFLLYGKYINDNKLNEHMLNITFSLDAINEDAFEKVKGIPGNNLKKVLKNIHYLLDRRSQMKLTMPNLTLQFIVMKDNYLEAEQFLEYWSRYLSMHNIPFGVVTEISYPRDKDEIFFRTEDDTDSEYAIKSMQRKKRTLEKIGFTVIKENISNNRNSSIINRRPCFQLWNMCLISRHGLVSPCCKDIFFELSLGNINEKNIEDMWLGDTLKEYRLSQIKGEFNRFKMCSNCGQPPGGYITDEDAANYLNDINKSELVEPYLERMRRE